MAVTARVVDWWFPMVRLLRALGLRPATAPANYLCDAGGRWMNWWRRRSGLSDCR